MIALPINHCRLHTNAYLYALMIVSGFLASSTSPRFWRAFCNLQSDFLRSSSVICLHACEMFVHKHKLLPFLSEASGDSKNLHNIQNVLSLTIIRLHSGKVRGRSYLCITEDWCGGGSCHSLCPQTGGSCHLNIRGLCRWQEDSTLWWESLFCTLTILCVLAVSREQCKTWPIIMVWTLEPNYYPRQASIPQIEHV